MTEPVLDGAVAARVKDAVVALVRPAERVPVQVSVAPLVFRLVQLMALNPLVAVALVALTPLGSTSLILTAVPEVPLPE